MSTDLLLIQPPVHMKRTEMGARQVSPGIGLAYIAALQRQRGRTVSVVDAHAERLEPAEVVRRVTELRPRVIGLSAMTYQIPGAIATARLLREALPDTVLILGGCHATALPERSRDEFPIFDACVSGEGEEAVSEIVDDALNGGLRARPSVWIRGGDDAVSATHREQIRKLDALPYPAFDLFPMRLYWPFYSRRWHQEIPMSASRGCPYHCSFCTKVMGERTRFRSPESLVDELLEHRRRFGVDQVIFTDENFTFRRSLVDGFCRGVIDNGLAGKVRFMCQSRVALEDETLGLMSKAGFTHITYGIESGDQEILDKSCKSITLEDSQRAVAAAKRHGMVVDGNIILGLPYETEETIRRTIDFTCSLKLDYASFFLLVPYPGSRVLDMAKKGEGYLRFLSDQWEDYGKQMGGAVELTTVSRRRLEWLQLLAYLRFYASPRRWIPVFRKVTLSTVLAFIQLRVSGMMAERTS